MNLDSTPGAIARQAAAKPDQVAVINNGVSVTYGQLARGVANFAEALRGLGLVAGQTVAVQCADMYLHLLLLFAAELTGAISVSFQANELNRRLRLLAEVDLVLTEHPSRVTGARGLRPIDRPWVESAFKLAGKMKDALPQPGDGVRILRTSGTTGEPKRVLLTRAILERRFARWLEDERVDSGRRELIAAPFTIHAMYMTAAAYFRAGATIVFEARVPLAEALRRHAITHFKALPLILRETLDNLPADWVRMDGLLLTNLGGKLAPSLRARAMDRLAGGFRDFYGSNEVGVVATIEPDNASGIATIIPDVRVEAIDAEGKALPLGHAGRLRVRSPYAVDRYLDDPVATARMFKDGWFYPGDIGILHAPDRLELIGRDDEILNIGGLKTVPGEIEETLRARIKVNDVGACVLPNADGIDELWVALVYDAPDDRDIRERIKPALRDFPYGVINVVKLASIPRTETRKIKRADLIQAVRAARRT
jgi:acyl-CoA synthetase (AMP-forming)/AMP-acid ligase II